MQYLTQKRRKLVWLMPCVLTFCLALVEYSLLSPCKINFQTFFLDESRWSTVHKTDDGPLTEYTLSFQNLLPSTAYTFRLIAYNEFGISYPVPSDEIVRLNLSLWLHSNFKIESKNEIL